MSKHFGMANTKFKKKIYSDGEDRPVEWARVLTGTGKGEKVLFLVTLHNCKKATIIYVVCPSVCPMEKNYAFTIRIFMKFYI